jgi:hypothetical protein
MAQKGNPTKVYVSERSDGNISFALSTERDGMEPLFTTFTLSPATLNLLSEVLHLAAHDSTVWNKVPDDEADKL